MYMHHLSLSADRGIFPFVDRTSFLPFFFSVVKFEYEYIFLFDAFYFEYMRVLALELDEFRADIRGSK